MRLSHPSISIKPRREGSLPLLGKLRDPARLRALMRTGLLQTDREPVFDRLTRLAARLFGTPVAALTLVDASQQWMKSTFGVGGDILQMPLEQSFCKFSIESGRPMVVEDAATHPVTATDAVLSKGPVRAYLGAPMILRDGHALGSLCVADFTPRRWTSDQIEMIEELAIAAVAEIELRGALAESARRTNEAEEAKRALEVAQVALRESETRFRRLADAAFEAVILTDGVNLLEVNHAASEMFGAPVDTLVGASVLTVIAPDEAERVREILASGACSYETIGLRHTGERFPMAVRVRFLVEHGKALRLKVCRDITDQRRVEKQLVAEAEEARSLSLRDELTGLANRRGFLEGAREAIKRTSARDMIGGIYFVDVNGMKTVNDHLGHEEGDRLLTDVATILRTTFRQGDILARLGGDEFAVFAGCGEAAFATLPERLEQAVASFNARTVRRYAVSISVGAVRVLPQGESDVEALLAEADGRMYEQKRTSGKHRVA